MALALRMPLCFHVHFCSWTEHYKRPVLSTLISFKFIIQINIFRQTLTEIFMIKKGTQSGKNFWLQVL
jgi:hypothetical protein